MSVYSPLVSWESKLVDVQPVLTESYYYTCKVNSINPNDHSPGTLGIDNFYIADYVGRIYQVTEIIDAGTGEVKIYDLIEDEIDGPYSGQSAYIYQTRSGANVLTQAQRKRLAPTAYDMILNIENNVIQGQLYPDFIQFNTSYVNTNGNVEGLVYWNSNDNTLDIHTGYGTTLQVGQEIHIKVYNDTGSTINNGVAVYPTGSFNNYPIIGLAQTNSHETIDIDYGLTTTTILDGEYGFVTWFGKVRDLDTSGFSVGDTIWVSSTTPGAITNIKPEFPNYAIQMGICFISDSTNGEIFITGKSSVSDTFNNFWNGTFRESFNFRITSDGTDITGTLTPSNGHPDMTMILSDGFTTLDTTPGATIVLTEGTDTIPQMNYVYIPKTTKTLTVSTSGWPTTIEHIRVAQVFVQSAITVATDGALRNQNWNDHIEDTYTYQGHLSHIGAKLRQFDAQWDTGCEGSVTDTAGNIYVSNTSGIIFQMHPQVFPAMSMPTDHINIINSDNGAYTKVNDLSDETNDASGDPLLNTSFSIVVWGIANKTGEDSHLIANMPIGTYSKNFPEQAIIDANRSAVYTIPKEYQGTGFLIARFTFINTSGVWSLYDTQDLRGFLPNATAGAGAGSSGITTFTGLTDTPSTYIDQAYKIAQVNAGETALEFTSISDINYWTQSETNLYYNGGNVGIGTTSPEYPISILSVDFNQLHLQRNSETSGVGINLANNTLTLGRIIGGYTSSTASYLSFSTTKAGALTEQVRITDDGNVGIGMETPITKSHIKDGGYIQTWENSLNPTTNRNRLSLYGNSGIFRFIRLDDGSSVLYGAEILSMDLVNERVGVKDASPSYTLDVNGTGRYTGNLKIGAYTLPNTDGTNAQVLQTNGSGTVSWGTVISKNQVSVASDTTPNPTGNYRENEYYLTALAGNAVFAAPSGTASNGNTLLIRVQDNGTVRTLNFTTSGVYQAVGVDLPTTTVASKVLYVGCIYNSTDSKWDVVSVVQEV